MGTDSENRCYKEAILIRREKGREACRDVTFHRAGRTQTATNSANGSRAGGRASVWARGVTLCSASLSSAPHEYGRSGTVCAALCLYLHPKLSREGLSQSASLSATPSCIAQHTKINPPAVQGDSVS
ncbi:hypothetical protein AAFF_G00004850 [Aldrovandia affinis]|uniref:Uncharacterized protein n=1 Tax=Aldrovandia affinis TaxID=143900 RepID=A0AAD7TFF8_9TELE|nr:hypothetical protein AAFF_G00004850 [Aldrovandia affinis]